MELWFDISPNPNDPIRTWADRIWAFCWKRPITSAAAIIATPVVGGMILGGGIVAICWRVFG